MTPNRSPTFALQKKESPFAQPRRRVTGKGQMADLVRAHNWASTPLGPIEFWPDALLSSVNLMLSCQFPTVIFWGPQMLQFYNDKYRPLMTDKHPSALGQSARECWKEAWHLIGPQFEAVLAHGETVYKEEVLVPVLRNGRLQDIYWTYSYSPIYDPLGAIDGILIVCHDVTDEIIATQNLRESEARATRILASIGDAVVVTDADTLITHMNAIAESLTGWTIDEAKGRPLREVFHVVNEDTGETVESPADRVKRLGTIVGLANHTLLIRKDGTETPIDDSGAPIRDDAGEISGIILVFRSIAERRRSEKSLQQSEERLRLALAAANGVGTWDWDVTNDLVYADTGFARLYGVNPAQAVAGINIAEFTRNIHPEDIERVQQDIAEALRSGEQFSCEYRILQADGSTRWVVAVGRSTAGPDGAHTRFPGVTLDITERKYIEEALRESKARFSAIYSASLEYIGIITPEGAILDCNRASLEFAGNTLADVVGKNFWDTPWFIHTPGAPEMVKQAVAQAATGKFLRQEVSLNRPSGEAITFDFSLAPVRDDTGKVVFLIPEGRDVTDLKRTESALIQSEKLAAVGRLASSIAHEINNPLESVMNLIYLAQQHAIDPDAKRFLELADQEIRRVSIIANQTLRFHKQPSNPQAVGCSELFLTVLGIYQGKFRNSKVTIEKREHAVQPITCFEGDIRQVLNNLVANAIDAMPNGGRLLLRSREATHWPTNRKGVALTVADTGIGMSPAILKNIFNPFFTTKGVNGTGLGLWVSQEIVTRHNGSLRVRSSRREGHTGTVFSLFLPFDAATR
jgi:PAS domain S-box-containing protein